MSKMRFAQIGVLGCWVMAMLALPASAANIGWVSFHGTADDAPSAAAMTAGFTAAPDKGYTDLLKANGHTVTRVLTKNDPTPDDLAIMNAFDLVIIGRSVDSTHYQSAGEALFWNSQVTRPVINMGAYGMRASRLGYYTAETPIPDTGPLADGGGPVRLQVTNPAHPIFAGVPLDGTNTMVNLYANTVTTPFAPNTAQRGISTLLAPIDSDAQVLATVNVAGDLANGGPIIAFFPTGKTSSATPNTAFAGPRLIFLSGSREHNGLTSNGAGIYDLTADGERMFLNAVTFMSRIPEPATATLVMVAIAGLGLIRKR